MGRNGPRIFPLLLLGGGKFEIKNTTAIRSFTITTTYF